jgi:acyl carrier protein
MVSLRARLTVIIAQLISLDIDPHNAAAELLVDGRLELDSLDRVELAICIEESFGVAMGRGEETRQAFSSVARLAEFIHMRSTAADSKAAIPSGLGAGLAPSRSPAFSFAQIFSGPPGPPPDAIQG